jgi:hypothetical protein
MKVQQYQNNLTNLKPINFNTAEQIKPDQQLLEQTENSKKTYSLMDKLDIKLPVISHSNNITKDLPLNDGSKVLLVYSKDTNSIKAYSSTKEGATVEIKQENLPKEFKDINAEEKFNGFFNNAHAKVTTLSDGEVKLYIGQHLNGGMRKSSYTKGPDMSYYTSPKRRVYEHAFNTTIEPGTCLYHSLHSFFNTSPAEHSSIYVGNDKVIGITAYNDIGIVEEHPIDADPVLSKCYDYNKFSNEEIAERAKGALGKKIPYDWKQINGENCHDFTNWCRGEQRKTSKIDQYI